MLWAAGDKLIYILTILGHKVIFMDQSKGQYVSYYLGVIPDRIGIYREVTNFVGVRHYYITMDTYIITIGSISDIWEVFSIDECVECWLVVEKSPNFINSGLCCGRQDGITHVHYAGVNPFNIVVDRSSL